MMKGAHFPAFALLALATFNLVSAFDPSPLQDFYVALNTSQTALSAVFVNGKFGKDPKRVSYCYSPWLCLWQQLVQARLDLFASKNEPDLQGGGPTLKWSGCRPGCENCECDAYAFVCLCRDDIHRANYEEMQMKQKSNEEVNQSMKHVINRT